MRLSRSVLSEGSARQWVDILVCPSCGVSVKQELENLECAACRKTWRMVDGIPHFVDSFPYWGEIPQENMEAVNHSAAAGSWRAALHESGDPAVQKAAEMILNLDRANWHLLVDLPSDSRVLDLGAGMGTNAHSLGKRFGEVIAVEPVMERIEFMRHRFAQEGLANVKPLRSSLWVLPFAKESFDLVAMNGVLEWVATGRPGDPADLQRDALRNVFDFLRPGGYFYLGIENRIMPGYFIGYQDPHCGLPFVTVLPRWLSDWYARRKGHKEGYRNYLYSSRGYRKLLESVGFNQIEICLALPTYNNPRFFIPLTGNGFAYYFRHFLPGSVGLVRRWTLEWALRLGLLQHCQYSFAILARK
jgi:SAM-dependent methyltransferase